MRPSGAACSLRSHSMKQFLLDILRQLTGSSFRKGRFSLTRFAYTQMRELHLDIATLEVYSGTVGKLNPLSKTTVGTRSPSVTDGMTRQVGM